MTELANPVTTTMSILAAAPLVVDQLPNADRVLGSKLPAKQIVRMPESCIVVRAAGGTGFGLGVDDYVPVSVRRVDVICYSTSPSNADRIALAAASVLKGWQRRVAPNRALVNWFKLSSGPIPDETPDANWPFSVVTFQVQLADELVPA